MMWTPFRKPTSKTPAGGRVRRLAASMAAVSLLAAACAADDSPDEADPDAGAEDAESEDDASPARTDLVIAQHRPLTDFAANNRGAPGAIATDQLYNVLIRFYEGEPEPQPELASSWEVAQDGTSVTLQLEEGVTFHDGDPFTSEDVAFSLDYVRDPENAASAQPMAALITDVETPDDHTVVVNFSQPNPAMFNMFNLIYMLDHRHPDDADVAGNGTGPFVLDEFVPDQRVNLTRNEDYWRDPAQLETVTIQLLPDPQAKLAQLRAGTVDLVTEVPPADFESFESSAEWVTGATAGSDLYQSFLINTTRPPLDDPQVREALSLAVNRERIAAEVVGAGAQPACLPYSDGSLAYVDELAAQCRFDLDAAQALLDEAGVSDLNFSISVAGGNANGARAAEIYQADLATIGVAAEVDQTDGPTYSSNRNDGNFDVAAQLYGGAAGDPAGFFGSSKAWDPNRNWPQFESDEYANAVAEAGSTMDEDARREAYREVGEIILQENFALPTAENPYLWTAASPLADLRFGIEGGYLILEFAHWEN